MEGRRPALEATTPSKAEYGSEPDFTKLWGKYNFVGEPPAPGTDAAKRLMKACEEYMRMRESPRLAGKPGSDDYRRTLHNNVAILTVGELRSGMTFDRAEEIANFACKVARGVTLDELHDDIMGNKRQREPSSEETRQTHPAFIPRRPGESQKGPRYRYNREGD